MLLSLVAHAVGYKRVVGVHNTVYIIRMWQAPSCSSGMANVGAYNTVRQMLVPTTLLGKCRRPQHCLGPDTPGRLLCAYQAWPGGTVLQVRRV